MRHLAVCLWVLVTAGLAAGADGQPPAEPTPRAADPKFTSDALRFVEDDAPVRSFAQPHAEAPAYALLVLPPRRLPAEEPRTAARRDLTFAHLFGADRAKYRGELVRVEGRLRMLRWMDPPDTL